MTYEQIYRVATLVYITNNKDNKIISGTASNQNIFFASLCIQAMFWNAAINPECTLREEKNINRDNGFKIFGYCYMEFCCCCQYGPKSLSTTFLHGQRRE